MSVNQIDVQLLKDMFLAGAQNLEANKEWINELNVFPVPDGDTGTNMTMTIMSAAREVSGLSDLSMKTLSKAIASGSLRGARGNSGVILSQLMKGFTKEIAEVESVDILTMAQAMQRATATAYKSVMQPKEGTILTVAREIAEKAAELAPVTEDLDEFMQQLIAHGDDALARTPELLPVLKQAGVVDSGGQGLMQVLKGCYAGYKGEKVTLNLGAPAKAAEPARRAVDREHIDTADIKFGYCTEFIVQLNHPLTDEQILEFKAFLSSIGDSIVCVADDEIVKIHVHTNHPGLAFEKGLEMGSLTSMKIDNMREEHREALWHDAEVRKEAERETARQTEAQKAKLAVGQEKKPYGFVAVSVGRGMNQIFTDLGVDRLIEGGQTMNPSTEDVLNAVESINADTVFVLPNNKNIVLAANQAAGLAKDRKVIVIPSKTLPQGIAAIISFDAQAAPEENEELMNEGMAAVRSAEITYAVRDSQIDGTEIHAGDYMVIGDKGILSAGQDLMAACMEGVDAMVDEDSALVTIYYGEDADEETAGKIAQMITEKYPDLEAEVHEGGQPVYYYYLSVE